MTTMTGQLLEDVHRDPRELERQADQAREDLERTLEELEGRISPNEIINRTLRVVREGGADFGRNLADQVRSNPLPTILTGIGIAWLLSSGERHSAARAATSPRHDTSGPMRDAAGTIRDAVGTTRETAAHLASGVREAAGHASSTTREAVEHAKSSMQNAAHRVASASRPAQEGYRHLSREQPFVLGALAVAAGTALGALLPSTLAENEWLGRFSDEATDRLREGAQRTWEGAKESVADAAERAVDQVERAASDAATSSPDDTSATRGGV